MVGATYTVYPNGAYYTSTNEAQFKAAILNSQNVIVYEDTITVAKISNGVNGVRYGVNRDDLGFYEGFIKSK